MLSRRWQMALHLLPLATSNVVMSLVTNSPRLVIESQMGTAELGNFSVVSSFLATGSLIFASIGHALLPSFAASVRSSHAQLFWRQLIGTIIGIVVACAIATGLALLIGRQILGIIYGPAFVDQNELLVVAAISGVPVYGASIVANGCYAANLRHGLLMSQVLALVTVVGGTALMVPWWGNFGAFAAISLSATAQMLFCLVLLALYWHSRKGADNAGKLG
jgi:O-antigen/teichoic acid export membrane protein